MQNRIYYFRWTAGLIVVANSFLAGTKNDKYGKQELYFVKENYAIVSTEVSAREKQGQNSGGLHQGVMGSLGSSSVDRPF